ncbi:alkaline phosphatase PhoX [Brevundimonas sp.]
MLHRRQLLTRGATAFAFAGMAHHANAQTTETYLNTAAGYGPLVADPNGLLDLPEGFSYQVVSQAGDTMDDGLFVPGQFDGMGCFALGGSRVALVRNHELKGSSASHRNWGPGGYRQERLGLLPADRAYDTFKDGRPLPGGTTTVVYDMQTRQVVGQHLSLAGTSTNCCGGQTPWGSWLTCEETEETPADADVTKSHGWVFEVPAAGTGLADPIPLTALGRFDHEAVCIDPRTGIVYLTEDRADGLFYRLLPARAGDLQAGGRLQAMAFRDHLGADTSNNTNRVWSLGDWREVVWMDLDHVDSPDADLRKRGHAAGAVLVARGEGIHWGNGELYLTATSGGPIQRGQILRYVPSLREGQSDEGDQPGRVQLFVESTDEKTLNMGDNLTVAPWGDLIVCEDNYSAAIRNHIKGVTPDGGVYTLARNVFTGNSEFAGAVMSPDGSTLFVNIQYPGITYAIRGPWGRQLG